MLQKLHRFIRFVISEYGINNGVVEKNTYNKAGNLAVRVQKKDEEVIERTEYPYDADGNMTYGPLNGVMTEFIYDSRNRLIRAGETTYEYDAENNRIAVETQDYRDEYVLDVESTYSQMLLAERTYTDGREETSLYVYGNGLIGEEKTTDDTKEYATYLYNHLGSTTAVTDENGAVIETYDYGAYGELLTDNMGTRRFLYNGQLGVVTDENGLYHMRARYYNTDIKRFISRDIVSGDITNSQSINRYCYVQGNPLSYTDPFGLSPEDMWSQTGHAILDVLGFVPVIGFLADIANAVWYYNEGDQFKMWCSIVSAIPGAGGLLGAGVKCIGKAAKFAKAGEVIKLGAQMAGNAGSLLLSGAIIWDNAINIGNYLAGNEYKYDVWDSVTAIGFALIGTVLGAKGLENSGKAFKGLKNKPAGIGSPNIGINGKSSVNPSKIESGKGSDNYVYRALNEKDYERYTNGLGLEAKNPNGSWRLKEHLVYGSKKDSWTNDPYISTTSDISVAKVFNQSGSGYGIVKIDMNKVTSPLYKGYEIYPRVNGKEGLSYHYSVWQQETSVYQSIPFEAIVDYFN